MLYDKEDLKTQLRAGDIFVTFKKVNGEERTMLCTLREEVIAGTFANSNPESVRVENSDVLRVFDVEKAAWRSFRVDSIVRLL